jgi:tetratricopeptide (TPR) repeat protein
LSQLNQYYGYLILASIFNSFRVLRFVFFFSIVLFSLVSQKVYAQSEDDILNSVGDQLRAEEEQKKLDEKRNKEYEGLKDKANSYYKDKKYDKAKALYKQMAELKPEADYPKNQLRVIEQQIEREKELKLRAEYDKTIIEADAALAAKDWEKSKAMYNKAAQLIPAEKYPKDKLIEVVRLKAAEEEAEKQARIQANYDAAIAEGEKALNAQNWDAARQGFRKAANIKKDEALPAKKLAEIDKLEKEAKLAEEKAALDKKYNTLISNADADLESKKWDDSRTKYKMASDLKPSENYPKSQLVKVDQLQREYEEKQKMEAELAAKQQEYKALIGSADALFKQKQYTNSIVKYQEASKVFPDEPYPADQIIRANELIAEAENAAREKEINEAYLKELKQADALFQQKNYAAAIPIYEKAGEIKPSESYPADQIQKSKDFMAQAEVKARQDEIDRNYNKEIASADALFKQKDWSAAILGYQKASEIKPSETYPSAQIDKINESIKSEEQREIDNAYYQEITTADALMKQKKWTEAIASYSDAQKIKPEESYPADQINKINDAIKSQEQQELDQAYNEEIASADQFYKDKNWNEAIAAYTRAETIKPDENYPSEQIAKAEQRRKDERAAVEEAGRIEKEFVAAVLAGDQAMESLNYAEAVNEYQKALGLKKDEPDVRSKLDNAEFQLKKAKEAEAKELQEQERLAKIDQEYNEVISRADQAFLQKNYAEAKSNYKLALNFKAEDAYATHKLDEIDTIEAEKKAELEAQRAEEARLEAERIEMEYNAQMQAGRSAVEQEDWNVAITSFTAALVAKPKDGAATTELETAQKGLKLAEEAEKQRQREIDDAYSREMTAGEQAIQSREWDKAKAHFNQALAIKPDAIGPKERIDEIDRLMDIEKEEQAKKEAAEAAFAALLAAGDKALSSGDLDQALIKFREAAQQRPNDPSPQIKMQETKELIRIRSEEEARRKAEEEARRRAEEEARKKAAEEARRKAALEARFNEAVKNGDNAVEAEQFKNAVLFYSEALEIKPDRNDIRAKLDKADETFQKLEKLRLAREAERRRKQAEELRKRREAERKRREEYLKKLFENSPRELAKRYPDGITVEVKEEGNKLITKSIVIENNLGRYLLKFDYNWGAHFYYLNGRRITEEAYFWDLRKYK